MIRFTALFLLLSAGILVGTPNSSAEPTKEPDASGLPWAIGDREPDDTDLSAFAKDFCVEMRKYNGLSGGDPKPDAARLRKYFDPRFLEKHNLADDEFPVQMAPVFPIYTMQIADDRKTILCVVGTKENASAKDLVKEGILLRVIVHEKKLYLSPEKGPDPKTKTFTPWILRMKL